MGEFLYVVAYGVFFMTGDCGASGLRCYVVKGAYLGSVSRTYVIFNKLTAYYGISCAIILFFT